MCSITVTIGKGKGGYYELACAERGEVLLDFFRSRPLRLKNNPYIYKCSSSIKAYYDD